MADYKNDRFARKPFNRGVNRSDGSSQKYKADCAKCGNVCEVPFRPNGKKPIYCSTCFVKDSADAPRGRRDFASRPSFERPQRDDRALTDVKSELQDINDKLERLLQIMEISRAVQSVTAAKKPTDASKEAKVPAKKAPAKKRASKKA